MGNVKCSKCGFLAVWDAVENQFREASAHFRVNGENEFATIHGHACNARCFIQKADLDKEISGNPEHVLARARITSEVIKKDRACDGYMEWKQGFHPKEHREMLDRALERRWRLMEGVIFALAGGIVALFAQWVSKPDVPVVNVSPPTVNVTTPPINVTVQTPPAVKAPKKAEEKKP